MDDSATNSVTLSITAAAQVLHIGGAFPALNFATLTSEMMGNRTGVGCASVRAIDAGQWRVSTLRAHAETT